jgi:very-short-patch-repair endonuclease
MIFFNRHETLNKRRWLRVCQTECEKILWQKLRRKGLGGYKFYRQYGIGPYIADFYCPARKFVIEIDGSQHLTDAGREYDFIRSEYMRNVGIKTIRCTNRKIRDKLSEVLDEILRSLNSP